MRKLLLAASAAIALSGCSLLGNLAAGPRPIAQATSADEALALSVETIYTAAARLGAAAFRSGLITPSTNPAVQLDSFCGIVIAGAFTPTDRGSEVAALECKLRSFRDATRAAYRAGNSTDYLTAGRNAIAAARELMALLSPNRGD